MKRCSKCHELKPETEFYKNSAMKDGLLSWCKACSLAMTKAYRLTEKGKDIRRRQRKAWKLAHPEAVRASKRRTNPKCAIKRYHSDPKQKISTCIATNIRQSLASGKGGRHWEDIVGYDVSALMQHLERQFSDGMSWKNYGEWHIDHKIPVSTFNYNSYEDVDFKRCWALTNLQPLWAEDNRIKGNKLRKPFQPSLAISVHRQFRGILRPTSDPR